MSRLSFDVRFWEKVDKSGPIQDHCPQRGPCWIWKASLDGSGYGWFSDKSKMIRAHRTSWRLVRGAIPDSLQVLHHCDNRRCVNPNHLFLGTNADNISDRMSKGRKSGAAGTKNGRAKLSVDDVHGIRKRLISGDRQIDIAKDYGVSQGSISWISRGQHWNAV